MLSGKSTQIDPLPPAETDLSTRNLNDILADLANQLIINTLPGQFKTEL